MTWRRLSDNAIADERGAEICRIFRDAPAGHRESRVAVFEAFAPPREVPADAPKLRALVEDLRAEGFEALCHFKIGEYATADEARAAVDLWCADGEGGEQ